MKAWNSTFNASTKSMKRSAFGPSVKPLGQGAKKMRVKRRIKADSIFRSEAYLAAVRSLPCVCCGVNLRTQPAHSNQLRFGKGRSIKASDATAIALCADGPGYVGCHLQHDQGGHLKKVDWWSFEYKHICLTIIALVKAGKLVGGAVLLTVPAVVTDWEATSVYLISLIESGQLKVAN
jgi:hypothetical protein